MENFDLKLLSLRIFCTTQRDNTDFHTTYNDKNAGALPSTGTISMGGFGEVNVRSPL